MPTREPGVKPYIPACDVSAIEQEAQRQFGEYWQDMGDVIIEYTQNCHSSTAAFAAYRQLFKDGFIMGANEYRRLNPPSPPEKSESEGELRTGSSHDPETIRQ